MSEPILRLSNVESAYGPITAIRGVSLEVPRGKIVAVLGANGAGKTTLLRTISGLVSVAITFPPGATLRAKICASAPGPALTTSAREPGPNASSSARSWW